MIEERLMKRAIEIRKTYLKITKDISVYESKAKKVVDTLQKTVENINTLQENIRNKKVTNVDEASKKLMSILTEVEKEGERLENLIDPLNKQIEGLRDEESELYRLIKEKHPNLSDKQIVDEIHTELKKMNLS